MDRQKTAFFAVIGSAVILVVLVSALRGWSQSPPVTEAVASPVATESASRYTTTPETLLSGVLQGKETWNGLQIEVVDVKNDGWPLVKAHNKFNKPPLPGKRMLLITVQVKQVKGKEPVAVKTSDFKVVGEQGVVYETYGKDTNCGVVPDALNGVVTSDHAIRGAVCVQVPKSEKGFVLVYEPYTGDVPAVYIPLPEGK